LDEDRVKKAVRKINQGKVQDKPATKPATTKDRTEIVVPSTREAFSAMLDGTLI
jgi:hypothetical protein